MADVLIRVQNVELFLEGSLSKEVREEIQHTCSYVIPDFKFLTKYKQEQERAQREKAQFGHIKRPPWDGTITIAKRYYKGNGILRIPSGLFSYVKEILSNNNISYEVRNERPSVLKTSGYTTPGLELRDYQKEAVYKAIQRGRGILKASTGCHAKGQGILMIDGSVKRVEDISIGDILIGPDSTPRTVMSLCRGIGQMYMVIPDKGSQFVVNEDHILTLHRTGIKEYDDNDVIDIRLGDWIKWSKHKKHIYKLFRAKTNFATKKNPEVDPYLFGRLLADKDLSNESVGLSMESTTLKNIGLSSEFIPEEYKTASIDDRLDLLAGYLDWCLKESTYDACSKSIQLLTDICFIARSVGLAAYIVPCEKICTNNEITGQYYRISISGDTGMIPYKILSKQTQNIYEKEDVLKTGFRIEKLGIDEYYGFTIDKDGRYLLDDFTVTHNSGKTEMIVAMAAEASIFPFVFYVTSCDLLEQAYDRFRKYIRYNGEVAEIGRVGAGHCDIKPITIATVQSCQRAIVGKFTKNKYDDYNADDKTKFSDEQKALIKEMVYEAQHVYVDECQHVSADTIQDILNNSHKAKVRIGGSASPWRDDGLDILIEACFGKRICDIDASFLIREKYLIKPYITFNHFNQDLGYAPDWQTHYKKYVVNNDERNEWIANRAVYHVEKGRPTIILVKWTSHAEVLKDLIKIETEVLTSSGKFKKSPKKRKEVLERMRSRDLMCIIGTSLLDEGVDVPSAGAGIFAGGGKSSTRELQRVGRFIRRDPSDPDKNAAFIEEFYDHTRWLRNHAHDRKKILTMEREFEIGDRRII